MTLHRLDSLAEGTRVRFPECGKIGTVVMHGLSGSRVKYESDERTVEIDGDDFTGKAGASFTVPGRPVLVSSGSEVLLWPNASVASTRFSAGQALAPALHTPRIAPQGSRRALSLAGGSETPPRNKSSVRSKRRRKMKR